MTIEEAIKQLTCDRDLHNFNPWTGEPEAMSEENRKSVEALDMAIAALADDDAALRASATAFAEKIVKVIKSVLEEYLAEKLAACIADDISKELVKLNGTTDESD